MELEPSTAQPSQGDEVIQPPEDVEFQDSTNQSDALETPLAPSKISVPPGTDLDSPIAIFKLFLPEPLWQTVVRNTNMYAEQQRRRGDKPERGRPWHPTTLSEIMVFIGVLIYMGIHQSPRIDHYWNTKKEKGPIHAVGGYISLVRFEQLKRYLHISQAEIIDTPRPLNLEPSTEDTEDEIESNSQDIGDALGYKLEPMISYFRSASERLSISSPKTSIDKLMAKYRAIHQPTFRSWWPLFISILDAAVANSHKIYSVSRRERSLKALPQSKFREALYEDFFEYNTYNASGNPTNAPDNPPKRKASTGLPPERLDTSVSHTLIQKPVGKRARCIWCMHQNKKRPRGDRGEGLRKISPIGWECSSCKVSLCHPRSGRSCQVDFHSGRE